MDFDELVLGDLSPFFQIVSVQSKHIDIRKFLKTFPFVERYECIGQMKFDNIWTAKHLDKTVSNSAKTYGILTKCLHMLAVQA